MIKKIFCGIVAVAGLVSCTDDYTDWSSPQSNAANEAAEKFEMTVTPSVTAVDFATETSEAIQLFSSNLETGQTKAYTVELTGNEKVATITADATGNVAAIDLSNAVASLYGRAPYEREITATISADVTITTADGEVVAGKTAAPFKFKATLVAPVIASAYYLVGDMFTNDNVNGWSAEAMKQFTHSEINVYDDPVFTVKFETTKENQYWKIIPQDNVDGEFWANPGVVGPATDGDPAMSGVLTRDGAGAGKIEVPGKYTLTINMMDYSYTIEPTPLELYMTGSNYNWGGTESDWVPMIPVNGSDEDFWTIIYASADEMVKFAPQAGWGNDFGGNVDVINDVAGAGAVNDGTNLKFANAGWYMLHVVNGATRKVEILEPNVYLIGDAAGEWNIADSHKFVIPTTADGTFESPAFAADCELRMCVSIDGFEWWMTEFMIFNGKIDFRGRGGDQARVNVTAGQKAYLNFKNRTGNIK